ncbi:MAG: hypothetical protein H8E42_11915 [Nitrospinae bacterium]|nr:hypothetical protein [Nitrospinota bacterium]MBL7020076.1 hypothetical protein [Nitrospinaceae bacterium]
MGTKKEMHKLIQEELEKWSDYDRKNEGLRANQIARFQSIRVLIEELIALIEPEYVKVNFLDDRATIEVGDENDCLSNITWTIQPNFTVQERMEEYWNINLWQNKINLEEADGFRVEEKRGNDGVRPLEFGEENEVINYLAPEIAKRVAFYRYKNKS